MKTIIIDDDSDILETYNQYLVELGFPEATLVSSPEKYKEKFEIRKMVEDYDLVLCDIHMPHLQGNEILKGFVQERNKVQKPTQFVVITGVAPDYFPLNDEGWGALAVADDILGKPVELSEFDKALRKLGFYPSLSFGSNF